MSADLETAIARALVRSRGAGLTADDGNWPREVAHYRELAAKHGERYTAARSLITDAFRDARAVLAEIEAQGCLVARRSQRLPPPPARDPKATVTP